MQEYELVLKEADIRFYTRGLFDICRKEGILVYGYNDLTNLFNDFLKRGTDGAQKKKLEN